MRRLVVIVLTLVMGLTLSACGDPEKDYCKTVSQDQARLSAMINSSSLDALLTDLPLLKSLAAKAPDDLTDEWQTFVNAVEGLRDALGKAGLKASDFKGGRMPDSVRGQERRTIIAAADTLSSDDVVSAANGIETQARDVCKVNLGL